MTNYIGNKPSDVPLTASDIPDLPTSKITSGTFAESFLTNATTDLQPLKSDITALALREATNESSASFNLPNQHIDTFATDTLGTKTDVSLNSSGFCGSINNITPTISGAGNSANSSPSFSINNTSGLITLDNSSVDHQGGSPDTNGVYWSILDYGQDLTFASGLMVDLLTGLANSGNGNIGICALNIKKNNGDWVFGSGGITPSVNSTFQLGSGGFISNANDLYNQTNNYQGIYGSTNDLASQTWYTWSGTATGRYVYVNWSNTHGEPTTYKLYDNSNGSTGNGTNIGVSGSKSVASATGTIIQNTNTVGSSKTEVGGTFLYKNNQGTATLGTDLKIYFTCNGGTNWTEASSYNAITPVYSTGISQVRLGKTTCTAGTDVRYKVEWQNQSAGSKETQLHGIGINY